MARFVKSTGASGTFIDRTDANRLDSDTAHIFQALGSYVGGARVTAPVRVADAATRFGFAAEYDITDDNPADYAQRAGVNGSEAAGQGTPVTPGQSYAFSIEHISDTAGFVAAVQLRWFDATVQLLLEQGPDFTVTTTGYQTVTFVSTAPALSETVVFQVANKGGPAIGAMQRLATAFIGEGTDTTFVPSLRIVGVADAQVDMVPDSWDVGADDAVVYFADQQIFALRTAALLSFAYPGAVAATHIPSPILEAGSRHVIRWHSDPAAGFKVFIDAVEVADIGASYTPAFPPAGSVQTYAVFNRPRPVFGGLAGSIYNMTLRDGVDGPVVARFDAEDIPTT